MKEGWTYKRLGDVSKIQNGFAFESKLFNSEGRGLPLIRIRDIKRGFSETYTDEECDDAYIVNNGEYLIGMDGDFNVGYWSGGRALLNQRVCKLVPSDKINPRYVYYYLPKALLEINSKTAYSTVKHLSSKQVAEINIPYPPLSEQEKIVSYLDAEFAKIDALKANIEQQLQAAKDLFQSALKEVFEANRNWKYKSFEDCLQKVPKQTAVKSKDYLENGMFPIVSQESDLISGYTDDENILYKHENPVIIFGDHTKNIKYIDFNFVVGADGVHILSVKDDILPKFFYYELCSIKLRNLGYARHYKLLKEKEIGYPKLTEQERIAARLDAISEKVKALQANYDQTINLCNDLKQSLLKSIFE